MMVRKFSQLMRALAGEENAAVKIAYIADYFEANQSDKQKDEALSLLLNVSPPRLVQAKQLSDWTPELTGYPEWLVERSAQEVGNPSKTLSLLLRSQDNKNELTLSSLMDRINKLQKVDPSVVKNFLNNLLKDLSSDERHLALQMLTGTYKSHVNEKTLIVALSQVLHIDHRLLCLRLYEMKRTKKVKFKSMELPIPDETELIPNEFPKLTTLQNPEEELGSSAQWIAFGKRPGIEIQLIKHKNTAHLWINQFGIISDKFPELISNSLKIGNDLQIWGQIVPVNASDGIELLTSRIKKKKVSSADVKKCAATLEVWSANGSSNHLNHPFSALEMRPVHQFTFSSWRQLQASHASCRERGFSGIVLVGTSKLDQYYFWKASSYSVRAVLLYVEFGSMSASGVKSLTFGLREKEEYVPIAKVNQLPKEQLLSEIKEFVSANTLERFGPVRTVAPKLLFELLFDEISPSKRHKCGFKLQNVYISKKCTNTSEDATSIDRLKSMF